MLMQVLVPGCDALVLIVPWRLGLHISLMDLTLIVLHGILDHHLSLVALVLVWNILLRLHHWHLHELLRHIPLGHRAILLKKLLLLHWWPVNRIQDGVFGLYILFFIWLIPVSMLVLF